MTAQRWILQEADPETVDELSKSLGIPRSVARVLVNRGLGDIGAAERFLSPTLRNLHPPEMLTDMDRAIDRICSALASTEPIIVYGDYDTDGITSMAVILRFMSEIGAFTIPVIPNREIYGYGLNLDLLEQASKEGGRLVITVDCGISDAEVIASAKEMGIDVIVTDHHELGSKLPPAYAVINPKRPDNQYPFYDLAGVGVAFLLVWALARRLKEKGFWKRGKEPSLKAYLDLVAIGTVADQAPLLGENRPLVRHGLRQMALYPRVGVSALIKACGFHGRTPSVGTLAFQLAPRLNAPGRIEDAQPALDLLLTDDLKTAEELARLLDGMNRKRQQLEEGIFKEACTMAEKEVSSGHRAIILASGSWHPGVLGIVASRLVERYGLPTVLLALQDGLGKGSARSPEAFHLMQNLRACDTHLQRYGGHRMAAGLRIASQDFEALRETFRNRASLVMGDGPVESTLCIDDRLTPDQVNQELLHHLGQLEPHGVGNPEPVFLMEGLEVAQSRPVGQDHLKLWVRGDGVGFDAIGFGLGHMHTDTLKGSVQLACVPQFNQWQGRTSIQLKLRDIRFV